MGPPIFLCSSPVWTKPARKKRKHYKVKWRNSFFWEQSVHCANSQEVKWKIPYFGIQTPRGRSQRKEGCKTPQGIVDRRSIFSALGTYSQAVPHIGTDVPYDSFKEMIDSSQASFSLTNSGTQGQVEWVHQAQKIHN